MNLKKTMATLVAGVMSVSAVATLAVSAQDELKAETKLYSEIWEADAKGELVIPAGTEVDDDTVLATAADGFSMKVTGATYVNTDGTSLEEKTLKASNFEIEDGALSFTATGAALASTILDSDENNSAISIEFTYEFEGADVTGDGVADKKKKATMDDTPATPATTEVADAEFKNLEFVDLTPKAVNTNWMVAEDNTGEAMSGNGKTITNWMSVDELFGGSMGAEGDGYWDEDEDDDDKYLAVTNDINANIRGYSNVTLTVVFSKEAEEEDLELDTNDYDNNGENGGDGASSDLAIRINGTKAMIGYAEFDKDTMSCSFDLSKVMGLSDINPVGVVHTIDFAFPVSSDLNGGDANDNEPEYYFHKIVVTAPASDDELNQLDKDLAAGEAETTVEATLPAATDAAATTAADAAATTAAGAASTDAAANPSTGNSAVALAVIPVAIAAAAFVAKKRG